MKQLSTFAKMPETPIAFECAAFEENHDTRFFFAS